MITSALILLSISLTPAQLYTEANESYAAGDFARAIEVYEGILDSVPNAEVYYNLGNAYFQEKQIGKAVLNFRRARFLSPRDEDISHNLGFVRTYRVDKIGTVSSPIAQLLSHIFHYFSLYEAAILTACLFLVGSILLSLFVIYWLKLLLYGAVVSGIACVFFFITWQVWENEIRSSPAVVVAREASALSGPGDDYKEILNLHDGTEVSIRESRGDYVLIQIPGGIGGWINQEALEKVF